MNNPIVNELFVVYLKVKTNFKIVFLSNKLK
jgi:hypothetical protein